MEASSQCKRRTKQCRLQLEIIDINGELERIAILHPNIRRTIDRARDLLGCYSHSISSAVDVREFCGGPEKRARMEVAA